MSGFVHLHVHSEYSLFDRRLPYQPLLDTAEALGQQAVAVTDHGAMYGCIDFYKEAKERESSPSSAARSMWPPRPVRQGARVRFERPSSCPAVQE